MNPVLRLCRYGSPHIRCLIGAVIAMVFYAAASGALAYPSSIKFYPIRLVLVGFSEPLLDLVSVKELVVIFRRI